MDTHSFVYGFISGFVTMVFVGFLIGRIRANRKIARTPSQKVSVPVKSGDSPSEIIGRATKAGARMSLWSIVLIGVLAGVMILLYRIWMY